MPSLVDCGQRAPWSDRRWLWLPLSAPPSENWTQAHSLGTYSNLQLRSPHVPHYRARHQIAPPHHLLSRLRPGQRAADYLRARLAGVAAELAPSVAMLRYAGLPRHRARYAW